MKINRRTLLRLLAPPLLLPAVTFPTGAAEPSDALFIVVDGIGPATPADRLLAFVAPFLEADLPIGLIAEAAAWSDPALGQVLAAAPDRVEPVLSLPGIERLPRYFQRRVASDAMQGMRGAADGSGRSPLPSPMTIATDAPPLANFDALRCLGIRNVLTVGTSPSVSSAGCAELAVCLRGGRQIVVAEVANPAARIASALAAPGWMQIALSLAGIEALPEPEVRLRAERISAAIARELGAGRRFASLPRNHARWFGADQLRLVAVRIDPGTGASAAATTALKAELQALGIAATDSMPLTAAGTGAWPEAACAVLPGAGSAARAPDAGPLPADLRCLVVATPKDPLPPRLEAAADALLVSGPEAAFDERGLVIRGETQMLQATGLLTEGQLMRDAILAIAPTDYATASARAATLDTLRQLQRDPGTRIVDVATFFAMTVAADPVFDLLRETRRDVPEVADPEALSAAELLADAREAWAFFERFSIAETGLCIDTADVQADGVWLHGELTMWDFGSLIAAVMAAHELGLITDIDFVARADLLVRALPVARIGAWMLPSEVISSDTGAPLSDDFNACDTGRLLSVLRSLDAYPLTRGIAEPTIARWDLAEIVVGGHVHSVVKGRLVDRFRSHCAHYTARAFRDRGIDAASPYEVSERAPGIDREMHLLLGLAGLGPLGAEPLLLEALEQGLSEPSAVLADLLLAAQRREYDRTGMLLCLSEAPLNREPWFTYQGLNVASSEDRWGVNAASTEARFATPAFRREALLVNTKAAYLWVATRPCAYSTLLARHVRARARIEGMGFAPGVFAATGLGMPGYADVNTNGIILEAIAYILRGRRPQALQ